MGGYDRDPYEDLDEYEEDGEDQEEEEGYGDEETYQPTKEELEYLELREKLKVKIRNKLKKELGTQSSGFRDKSTARRQDNFGSFFGPSQPIIAKRVIEESKSLLENPNLAATISKSNHSNNKHPAPANIRSKPQSSHQKVTNGVKSKIEMLKNIRDYSFLSTEDAEFPASANSATPKNLPVAKSEARPSQLHSRSTMLARDERRGVSTVRDDRRQLLASRQSQASSEVARASHTSVGSVKQPGNSNGSGPGRPLGIRQIDSRSPADIKGKKAVSAPVNKLMSGQHKSTPASSQFVVRKPIKSQFQSTGSKATPSNSQPPSKSSSLHRKNYEETNKPKVIPKHKVISQQALPSARNLARQPPSKSTARGAMTEVLAKTKSGRRPLNEESDDDAINMIRQMFKYDPKKYRDMDDDSDMEANFDDILKEEQQSAKIAQQEDEEELRKLEEEERRIRLAKKRKLTH